MSPSSVLDSSEFGYVSGDEVSRPRALISVADKTGIVELAKSLESYGWEIIASGGTADHLLEAGVEVTSVTEITDFPEILDGRVKTTHPKIFGGILADRNNLNHLYDLVQQEIDPIEMVVCNFYPFEQMPSLEMIDIGGPAMVRAAAKNYENVLVLVSPSDYAPVLEVVLPWESATEDFSPVEMRRSLARKAFEMASAYDAAIAEWLS